MEERQMKVAISIAVAVVMPLGFFILFGIIVSHVLAKRRQRAGHPSALGPNLEFEPAAAQTIS